MFSTSTRQPNASPPKDSREWFRRLDKFGDNSSFSATVYEFRSKSTCKRLLWGLIIVAALAGFGYITSQNVYMLIREPIQTSITENREKELEFPAVTICSLSFANKTKLDSISESLQYPLRDRLLQVFDIAQRVPPDEEGCMNAAQHIASYANYTGGFSQLITKTARVNILDLVELCTFEGENCMDELVTINTVSGVCFTFNGPNTSHPHEVGGTGIRQGLRIALRNGEQYFSLNNNLGFSAIVHNPDEPPRPESEGIVVGLTSNLNIGMKQVISVDKTLFYSGQDCVSDTEFTSGKLSFPGYSAYSRSLCLNDCFYTQVADKCNCIEGELYSPVKSPYTEMKNCTLSDLCCEVIAFSKLRDDCDCPLKCDFTDRTLTTSSATHTYPDRVGINVHYETLVTEVRETTDSYSPWSLISDIGGNTGLFMGFTLLTVGEVVLLSLALFTDCCCSPCKKRMRECWEDCDDCCC